MNQRCLLVCTQDKKRYLTRTEYLPQLVEFSTKFGAELSIIQSKSPNLPIMELDCLAPAICNPDYESPNIELEVLEVVKPENINFNIEEFLQMQRTCKSKAPSKKKETATQKAKIIRDYIKQTFLQGEVVDIKIISKKFNRYSLRLYTFAAHIKTIRDQLILEGREINKLGVGMYQLK